MDSGLPIAVLKEGDLNGPKVRTGTLLSFRRSEHSSNWCSPSGQAAKNHLINSWTSNWLFTNTAAGAQSSAIVYSVIETAKENLHTV